MNSLKIAVIGECMAEIQLPTSDKGFSMRQALSAQISYGGDTLNTAIYLNRLLRQTSLHKAINVDYITLVGDDPFGLAMREAWLDEGLGCELAEIRTGQTSGLYAIQTDQVGERHFSFWRHQAPARQLFSGEDGLQRLAKLHSYDWLIVSGIGLAILEPEGCQRLMAFLKEFQGKLLYDTNHRPRLWLGREEEARTTTDTIFRLAHIILPSEEDLEALWPSFASLSHDGQLAFLSQYSRAEWVVRRGGKPLDLYADGQWSRVELARLAKVVDTTAAGDSFNAGYFAARLQGMPPQKAALRGHELARVVIGYQGAIIPLLAMNFGYNHPKPKAGGPLS